MVKFLSAVFVFFYYKKFAFFGQIKSTPQGAFFI
jgi:hypothetical protein